MNTIAIVTARQSAFGVPTLARVRGGLCPQTGVRRVDAHTQAFLPVAAGAAAMATGRRPWSSLIT
jgi:hypothetical protein